MSRINAENATLAEYLKADLRRIVGSANDELKTIRRAGMSDSARHAEEARVIDDARARAMRRVESAVRHLRTVTAEIPVAYPRRNRPNNFAGTDLDKTQVLPAIKTVAPPVDPPVHEPVEAAPEPRWETAESTRNDAPVVRPVAGEDEEPKASAARRRALVDDSAAAQPPEPHVAEIPEIPEIPEAAVEAESDTERLQRILAFVVRQEPGLSWAVGDTVNGTTVVVTDLAHGWIPPGITLPEGVWLLEPQRRIGRAAALIGETTSAASYTPGDFLGRSTDFAATNTSVQPRELPPVDDLGWTLGQATHWRDELPRIVHTLARAAAAGTGIVDEEVDLLRVHLDTARYQLLGQYPDVDPTLLLNCLLLAATEALVDGDSVAANYHLAWFQKLSAPLPSQWAAKQPF